MPDGTYLKYNEVEFQEPTQCLAFDGQVVNDPLAGVDYLFTNYRIRVHGYLNSKSTSRPKGSKPVDSWNAISDLLSQPRQSLVFTQGGSAIALPANGRDVVNGPKPKILAVSEMIGDNRTWEIVFEIEVAVRYNKSGSAVISNRWSMQDDVDQDFFCSRSSHGRTVFDANVLASNGLKADDLRNTIFPTCPDNFKRDAIHIVEDADGLGVSWAVTDREQPINLVVGGGVTRIEATHTMGVKSPGQEQMLLNAASIGVNGAVDIAVESRGASIDPAKDTGVLVAMGAIAARTAFQQFQNIVNTIPRLFGSMTVRVWGQRGAKKDDLMNVALNVLFSRLTAWDTVMANCELSQTEDVAGRFVEVTGSYTAGPFGSMSKLTGGVLEKVAVPDKMTLDDWTKFAAKLRSAIVFPIPKFPATDDIKGIFTSTNQPGFYPPGDGGCRGTYLGKLFAAVLLEANEGPKKPA